MRPPFLFLPARACLRPIDASGRSGPTGCASLFAPRRINQPRTLPGLGIVCTPDVHRGTTTVSCGWTKTLTRLAFPRAWGDQWCTAQVLTRLRILRSGWSHREKRKRFLYGMCALSSSAKGVCMVVGRPVVAVGAESVRSAGKLSPSRRLCWWTVDMGKGLAGKMGKR